MESSLFFKVFKNVYIKNIIYNHIENQIIKYDDINCYYMGNRMKFQDITSLYWMVLHGTWEILKDKLKSDQFISMESKGIEIFIEYCNDRELITLLLKKKYKKFIQYKVDLIELAISYNKLKTLKLFINKFNIQLYPSHLILAISKSTIEIVSFLLSFYKTTYQQQFPLDDKFKQTVLSVCFENTHSIQSLILNNSLFFTKSIKQQPTTNTSEFENYNKNKKTNKTKQPPSSSYSFSSSSSSIISLKITFNNFINIGNRELQIKLLDSNQVERSEITNLSDNLILETFKNGNNQDLIFYINVIYKLLRYNISGNNKLPTLIQKEIEQSNLQQLSIQQLLKIIVNEMKSDLLFFNYLLEYDDILQDYNDQLVYEYTFTLFSLNGLKYLIGKYNNIEGNTFFKDTPRKNVSNYSKYLGTILKNQNRLVEFLRFYYSKKSIASSKLIKDWKNTTEFFLLNLDLQVLDTILNNIQGYPIRFFSSTTVRKIPEFHRHRWYIDNILRGFLSPMEYRYYNKVLYILDSTDKIDYILDNFDFFQYEFDTITQFPLQSYEMANYFESKLKSMSLDEKYKCLSNREYIYDYSFSNSISNFDINTLIKIDQLNLNFNLLNFKFNQHDNSTGKLLFNYLNKVQFKSILGNGFGNFIKQCFKSFDMDQLVVINFNIDPFQSLLVAHEFIFKNKFDWANLILELIQLNGQAGSGGSRDVDEWSTLNHLLGTNLYVSPIDYKVYIEDTDNPDKMYVVQNKQYPVNQVFKFIKSIVQFKPPQSQSNVKNVFSNRVFNHLYNYFIQCFGLKLVDIQEINNLYNEHAIEIQLDFYKVFYYINTKSIKLGQYILNRVDFIKSDHKQLFINELEFSFDIINDMDFNNFFLKIRNQLNSFSQIYSPTESIGYLFSQDIQFCLKFNEINIMFNLLDNGNGTIDQYTMECCFKYLNFENCLKLIQLISTTYQNHLNNSIISSGRLQLFKHYFNSISQEQQDQLISKFTVLLTPLNDSHLNLIKFLVQQESIIQSIKLLPDFIKHITSFSIQYGYIEFIDLISNFKKNQILQISISDINHCVNHNQYNLLFYLFDKGYNKSDIKNQFKKFKKLDYNFLIDIGKFK